MSPIRTIIPVRGRKLAEARIFKDLHHADKNHNPRKGTETQYGYAYLPTDFKKNNGFLTSTKMTEAYHLYRQPYCGCIFGARDQGLDLEKIRQDAEAFLAQQESTVGR